MGLERRKDVDIVAKQLILHFCSYLGDDGMKSVYMIVGVCIHFRTLTILMLSLCVLWGWSFPLHDIPLPSTLVLTEAPAMPCLPTPFRSNHLPFLYSSRMDIL